MANANGAGESERAQRRCSRARDTAGWQGEGAAANAAPARLQLGDVLPGFLLRGGAMRRAASAVALCSVVGEVMANSALRGAGGLGVRRLVR
mmetsp:Transcript_9492/g.18970  ORF Transcript_9492/g.18970 Transcript_9492/m.18970 type:complete len:92 (-) Transcript_9492:182-457(-)